MGYHPVLPTKSFDKETRKALVQYQKDNELPKGNLNMLTLKKLGL